MAVGGDRLAGFEEVANQGDRRWAVAQVFRCPSSRQNQTLILLGLDFVQPKIGLDAIAGFFGVRIEPGLEVVDDREKSALSRSAAMWTSHPSSSRRYLA